MNRFSLVLFMCLSLQLNVASAPFVHLHADESHEDDHHDGRVVHRHLTSHGADDDHEAGPELLEGHAGDGPASVEWSSAAAPTAFGPLSVSCSPATTIGAPPAIARGVIVPSEPTATDDDVGDRALNAPDSDPSSLRGPPR